MSQKVTDLLLYRRRYLIGQVFLAATIIIVLIMAWLYAPGGIDQREMTAVVATGKLSLAHPTPSMAIDLPYHLLQRGVFALFGVSILTIKLPSLLLAIGTIAGLYILLRNWFRKSIAIPAVFIGATMTQFIYLAQNATPRIFTLFIAVWLLVLATFVAWKKRPTNLWKPLLFVAMAASLYTPLGIYLVATLMTTVVFHPRSRALFTNLSPLKITLGSALFLMLIAPLGYAIYQEPKIGLTLLGIPSQMPNIGENAIGLAKDWFGFLLPASGEFITPMFPLGVTLLMLIGLYRLAYVRYTARSYITWIWMLLLVPLIIVSPDHNTTFFVVALLLIVRGLSQLLPNGWYRLFPSNPYARVIGALPVYIVILMIIFSSLHNYFYSYHYTPGLANRYSKDISLLTTEIHKYRYGRIAVLTSTDQREFYNVVAKYHKNFTVITDLNNPGTADTMFVTHAAYHANPIHKPIKVLTTSTVHDSDRFYIYNLGKK